MIAPATPTSRTLAQIDEALKAHLNPKPKVITERYRFHRRVQQEGETITNYIAALKKLAETCAFGDLNITLRDQFVCGLTNEATVKRLLTEDDSLTHTKAFETALAMEMAARDTAELHNKSLNWMQGKQKEKFKKKDGQKKGDSRRCYRCGSADHLANVCKHKESICSACKKLGHLAVACRSKEKSADYPGSSRGNEQDQSKKTQGGANFLDADDKSCKSRDWLFMNMLEGKLTEPYRTTVKVEGVTTVFEIDTDAAVTVIASNVYKEKFSVFR